MMLVLAADGVLPLMVPDTEASMPFVKTAANPKTATPVSSFFILFSPFLESGTQPTIARVKA